MPFFGWQSTERTRGWAADVCPSCRTISAVRVREGRRELAVLLVPTSIGYHHYFECTCESCNSVYYDRKRLKQFAQSADFGLTGAP